MTYPVLEVEPSVLRLDGSSPRPASISPETDQWGGAGCETSPGVLLVPTVFRLQGNMACSIQGVSRGGGRSEH